MNILSNDILRAETAAQNLLYGQDIVLVGGDPLIDNRILNDKTKFYVQLNHHFGRRANYQICNWLIARKGSGMCPKMLKDILRPYPHRVKDLKIISAQINEPELFKEWQEFCLDYDIILLPFHEKGHRNLNPFHFALEWCNQFSNEIVTNPFIGMLALKMVSRYPVQSIKMIGYSFYQDHEKKIPKNRSCHNVDLQIDWLRKQYATDYRIQIEDNLNNILGNPRDEFNTVDVNL